MKISIISIVIFSLIFIFLISPSLLASSDTFYIKDDLIYNIFPQSLFMEDLGNFKEIKLTKQRFLNKTVKFEYGGFRPKIRKGKDLNDYFKKLNLDYNEIYVLLEFEDNDETIKNFNNEVLKEEGIKKIGIYGKDLYTYKFPKEIIETKTYDFIKWIDVPKKQTKIDRELKNSLELDKALIVKVEFYLPL